MADGRLVALLALLVSIGPLATSLYTPSLPDIARGFAADPGVVQLTISLYLVAFAVGQLAYGPLADAHGRRPALLGGLALFVLASLACAVAPGPWTLVWARFVQAAGCCAVPVVVRAVVRDRFPNDEAARVMATISAALALAPAIAPSIGGLVQEVLGWRWNFVLLAAAGAILMAMTARHLPESLPPAQRSALRVAGLFGNYARLLRNPAFLVPAGAVALMFGGLFAFVTGGPFLFISGLGVSPQGYGLWSLVMAGAFIPGALVTRRFVGRLGSRRTMQLGALVCTIAGAALPGLAAAEALAVLPAVGAICLFQFGMGLVLPAGITEAVAADPRLAGSASALVGFLHMGVAAGESMLVAALDGPGHWAMTMLVALSGLATLALTCARR